MRLAGVVALTLGAALAQADRLITIPTARKLPLGTVRYEFRGETVSHGETENFLAAGISTSFDMELRTIDEPGRKTEGTFDLSYNFVAPIPGLTPGLSLGLQDATDKTPDGRRFFGAATFRPQFSTLNGDFPADVTLGVFGGRHWSPFVGVLVPFSKEFHFLAEHNGERIAVGFEYRPVQLFNLRYQVIGKRSELGAQVTTKF